jgi:hypothetical protein
VAHDLVQNDGYVGKLRLSAQNLSKFTTNFLGRAAEFFMFELTTCVRILTELYGSDWQTMIKYQKCNRTDFHAQNAPFEGVTMEIDNNNNNNSARSPPTPASIEIEVETKEDTENQLTEADFEAKYNSDPDEMQMDDIKNDSEATMQIDNDNCNFPAPTRTRSRYENYDDISDDDKILILKSIDSGAVTAKSASDSHKINYSTLRSWLALYRSEHRLPGARGRQSSIPASDTDEIKKAITARINAGVGCERQDVKNIFINAGITTGTSESSISRWLAKNKFSFRMTEVAEKAPPVLTDEQKRYENEVMEERIWYYQCHVYDALTRCGASRVFNLDETLLCGAPKKKISLQIRGKENVRLLPSVNTDRILTAVHTVRMDGGVLPILFLKKGKRYSALSVTALSAHLVNDNELRLTEKGWMRQEMMIEYFGLLAQWVSPPPSAENPIALILDCHDSHRTDGVRLAAYAAHIDLIYVPATQTSRCQPLDRDIFGKLKHCVKCAWKTNWTKFDFFVEYQKQFAAFNPSTVRQAFVDCINIITQNDISNYHHVQSSAESVNAILAIDAQLLQLRDLARAARR